MLKRLRAIIGFILLLFVVFFGVQKVLYQIDYKVYKDVGEEMVSGNIDASKIAEEYKDSKKVLHVPKKNFKGDGKLITVYLQDFEPDRFKIFGKVKKEDKTYDYVLSGYPDGSQELNINGKKQEGTFVTSMYRGLKVNLLSTEYTIVDAECLLICK